jgi:ABC-2 type transport system permease protein
MQWPGNPFVVRALAKRDFLRYFENPTGYLFITLFVLFSGAAAFWQPDFFLKNLATLDELNEVYCYLLVFFVSALTMGVWADESRQGTDQLIWTLPATNLDVVLGKYLAVFAVFTVALLLSLSHVAVLVWLGRPDPGMLAANYLGNWLSGAALIPIGMLASFLSPNVTVAFVLSVLACSLPIWADAAVGWFDPSTGRALSRFTVMGHFSIFARGLLPIAGFVYFGGLIALALFGNVVLASRRQWPAPTRVSLVAHSIVRLIALAIALAAATELVDRVGRFDITTAKLHSLSEGTRQLVGALPVDRRLSVHAFISPMVPEEYVQQRENLMRVLDALDELGRGCLDVTIEQTEPYSTTARHARERFGLGPRLLATSGPLSGRFDRIFLGAVVTSGPEEQVIPFFEPGLSVEYELARAIRVVSGSARKRIGIVRTDVRIAGGIDFESGRPQLAWSIVDELRKQYEIVELEANTRLAARIDALLVVLPSTLLQRELDNVTEALLRGVPTLILVDPIPSTDMRLAPAASMAARANPYADSAQSFVRKNTGDVQGMLAAINVKWAPTVVAWDSYNPHPDRGQPREVVFVGSGSGSSEPFNSRHVATANLQEVMFLFPGHLQAGARADVTFHGLLRTGRLSGLEGFFQLFQPSSAGLVLNPNVPHLPEGRELVLAAHVRGLRGEPKGVNAIVIADLDFIADGVIEERSRAPTAPGTDNVTFFLNCMDVLAGEEGFIALRQRRLKYPTLERIEEQVRVYIDRAAREERQAAAEADAAFNQARDRLGTLVNRVKERRDLDPQAQQMMVRNIEAAENRKLNALRGNLDLAKSQKIEASRENMEASIRRVQGTIRLAAVLVPPLPVLCLAVGVLLGQRRRERESAAAMYRLRNES